MSQIPKNSNATTANQEDEPHEGPSTARSQHNTIALASKQFNDVIQFQEPSTSKSYSFKTEIRINIIEEPSENSFDINDGSSCLTLFRGDKKGDLPEEESFMTTDTCVREKSTGTIETIVFSRDERTQRAVLRGHSEAPPPYISHPPPPYMFREPNAQSPYYSRPTNNQYNQDIVMYNGIYPGNDWMILCERLRRSFTRKVLCTVGIQFSISTAIVASSTYHQSTKMFMNEHIWMGAVCLVGFMTTLMFLGCIQACRKVFPWNYFLLLINTLSLSYAAGMIAATYSTNSVLISSAVLTAISFLIALVTFQPYFEVTSASLITCLTMTILFAFGFSMMLMQAMNRIVIYDLIWSSLVVLVVSICLLLDLQLLLRGKRYEISPEDYIYAAAVIFTDVLMIFVYFGQLLYKRTRRRN